MSIFEADNDVRDFIEFIGAHPEFIKALNQLEEDIGLPVNEALHELVNNDPAFCSALVLAMMNLKNSIEYLTVLVITKAKQIQDGNLN